MSIIATYVGALTRPTVVAVLATETDIVEADAPFYAVSSIVLTNTTGSGIIVEVKIEQDASSTTWWKETIAANSSTIITDAPIRLKTGSTNNDKLTAIGASTGVNCTAHVVSGSGQERVI